MLFDAAFHPDPEVRIRREAPCCFRAVAGTEERLFVGHRLVPDAGWDGDALDVELPVGEDASESAQRRPELRGVPRCDDDPLDDGVRFGHVVRGGFRHSSILRCVHARGRARLPLRPYSPRPSGNLEPGESVEAGWGGKGAWLARSLHRPMGTVDTRRWMPGELQGKKVRYCSRKASGRSGARAEAGARETRRLTHIVAPEEGVCGRGTTRVGDEIEVDVSLDRAVEDYDALVLPGGVMNPASCMDARAVTRTISSMGKPVASICHGPWMLIGPMPSGAYSRPTRR